MLAYALEFTEGIAFRRAASRTPKRAADYGARPHQRRHVVDPESPAPRGCLRHQSGGTVAI
jgi:hypothetical protein